MRTEGLMAKDKVPRKVAKKGQPGGRQEAGKAVPCKAEGGRRLSSYASSEVSVGPGSKKAVGDAGRGLS